jgi:KDO2-lipid IV(A) lauroyltransferase
VTSRRDQLTELGYAAGWRLVRMLPLPAARALFNQGADRAAKANGPSTQRLRRNLRTVVGPDLPEAELDRLVRDGLRSYARYWMEAFRLPSRSREDFLRDFDLVNADEFHRVLGEGKGAILALPHMGNWDAAAAWLVSHDYRMVTVMERLKPEGLYKRFIAYREKLGMEVLPLTGGRRPPLDVLAEKATQGYAVPLLADRDLSARGVEVRFFGGRTRMPAGPAILALRTGAPLYAVDLWYTPDKCLGRIRRIELPDPDQGALDVRVRLTTQKLADAFELGIAEHPQDWHMLQKLWLDQSARV